MSGSYANPFTGAALTPERIDQGVDYSGHGTIAAIGDAIITEVKAASSINWPGTTYIAYQLTNGPYKGKAVYVAEGVTAAVQPGQHVKAGQTIANIIPGAPTGFETGWAQTTGAYQPLAQITGGYIEGQLTTAGQNFSNFLGSLGAPEGLIEGRQPTGQKNAGSSGGGGGGGGISFGEAFNLFGVGPGIELATSGTGDAIRKAVGIPSAGELAGGVAGQLFTWIKEWFGGAIVRGLLYTVLAGGGLVLILHGLTRAVGVQQPARKAARAAGMVAAA